MADSAALQVQERLKALYTLVRNIESERSRGISTLDAISKAQEDMNVDGISKLSAQQQQKLKNLYVQAAADATQEEELLRQALSKIYEIRSICNERQLRARIEGNREVIHRGAVMKMLQVSAQTLPLWVGKPGTKAPPLCGAIPPDPSYVAKPGDMVAALAKTVDSPEENWILAEVIQFNPVNKKYEVDDIDEELKPRHILNKRRVVALPLMRANPETDPDALFAQGSIVMALYPQTTCFYKAIVNLLPATATDDYEVLFEDPTYSSGYAPPLKVAQRYIIEIKERKKP